MIKQYIHNLQRFDVIKQCGKSQKVWYHEKVGNKTRNFGGWV